MSSTNSHTASPRFERVPVVTLADEVVHIAADRIDAAFHSDDPRAPDR